MIKTFLALILINNFSFAETKLSVDVNVTKLNYKRPVKGIGKAGNLIFTSANVNNNGIVLNINNVNNLFDSQIFIRPTFLGFVTQFGNYGFPIEEKGQINSVLSADLVNTKIILDDNQLNISGSNFNLTNTDTTIKLNNFRLYCQNPNAVSDSNRIDSTSTDMMQNCFSYLTLNGSVTSNNEFALLDYEGLDLKTSDKTNIKADIKSIDIRKKQIIANLKSAKIISNDSYFINTNDVQLTCAKDEHLVELDSTKIKYACLNDLKLSPTKASLIDQKSKTKFDLELKDLNIKSQLVNAILPNVTMSDTLSTTSINNLIIQCRKNLDTDVLELPQVLNDCAQLANVTIGNVNNSKPSEQKDPTIKNISLAVKQNNFTANSEVKILGFNGHATINGKIQVNMPERKLIITVLDTKLPFGITSVKLLMYVLKKNFISKDILINGNIITILL